MRPYEDSLVARRTTANGVFSLKVHWRDWAEVQRRYALDETWFPQPVRWVHITRRDTVAQAVSRVRADQTGRWVSHGAERWHEAAVYDRAAILAAYREVRDGDAAWRAHFTRGGIQPVEVVYEELVDDYEGTIMRVAAALGEQIDTVPAPRLQRQADEVNLDWTRRFRADAPALGVDLVGDAGC
jgi:LPS sulfotransferase NodH